MTRYCANLDGKHAGGLNVCASCARKFREALGSIAVDTPALLLIAARQAGTGDNDRTGVRSRSAHAPLLIREQAWELYCQAEELIRLAALQCGCPPATRRTASVRWLVRGILKDDKLLLTASGARRWWRDVVDVAGKVNRMVDPPATRVAFGACPFCKPGRWSRLGCAARSHGRMPFLRRAGEPHLRRRPAARQARQSEEEGHAQAAEP